MIEFVNKSRIQHLQVKTATNAWKSTDYSISQFHLYVLSTRYKESFQPYRHGSIRPHKKSIAIMWGIAGHWISQSKMDAVLGGMTERPGPGIC